MEHYVYRDDSEEAGFYADKERREAEREPELGREYRVGAWELTENLEHKKAGRRAVTRKLQ